MRHMGIKTNRHGGRGGDPPPANPVGAPVSRGARRMRSHPWPAPSHASGGPVTRLGRIVSVAAALRLDTPPDEGRVVLRRCAVSAPRLLLRGADAATSTRLKSRIGLVSLRSGDGLDALPSRHGIGPGLALVRWVRPEIGDEVVESSDGDPRQAALRTHELQQSIAEVRVGDALACLKKIWKGRSPLGYRGLASR